MPNFYFSIYVSAMSDSEDTSKESRIHIESMAADKKIVPNENTKKLKELMRQLSNESPIMTGTSANSLAQKYMKIFTVVAIYW